MKKYLLFVWIAVVFCSCNEDNFDISPMEADATCANIIDDEHFVSVSQASKVGSLFLNNNGNGNCVHTRNSSVVPEATSDKTARETRTIYNENGVPCMYVINYESGGFVIVSATKNYYPILAYSETGSMNVEEAMKTGFSVWSEKTIQKIVESSSWGGDSQAEFQRMWVAYDKQEVEVAPLYALNDGVLFRQRMNELYELCPGYSFGPLTSARSFLSQSEYDSYVEKAELYGSPLEFTIVGYKRDPHERVGPLINTVWSQKSPFNGLCPQNCLAGCVAIAVAQIMRYHEWPATYNWSDMPNTTATIATQTLIADVGKAVDMEYGESASKSSIGKAALGFWAKGYNVELNIQLDLFETAHIRFECPYRINQKDWKPTFIPYAKARKRIETLFSQLTNQFMTIRNYAKITNGLFARIIGKISAMTVLQYINFINGKPIGRIKYALI